MVNATLAVVVTIDEALEALVVTIDARSRYYINYGDNQHPPVVSAVLAQRVGALLRQRPGLGVFLRADEHPPTADVVGLVALLEASGASSVGRWCVSASAASQPTRKSNSRRRWCLMPLRNVSSVRARRTCD